MAIAEVKIMRTYQDDTVDQNTGRIKPRMAVKWSFGDDGPFVDYFDFETFDANDARRAIEQRAQQLRALRG